MFPLGEAAQQRKCVSHLAVGPLRAFALTEIRARELLSEVLQRVNGEGLRVFTVRQWFEHFAKQKRKSKSEKTALRHEQMHKEFLAFLGSRADLNVAAITSKDILDFRDEREAKGLAPGTVNLDITVLSSAFNAALRQGHVSVNPCVPVEPLKDKAVHKKVSRLTKCRRWFPLLRAIGGSFWSAFTVGCASMMRAICAGGTSISFPR
jgi:hypothetical protein